MVDEVVVQGESASGSVSRRTLMKGAAWTVPALMVATAAPAYAVSCPRGVFNAHGHGKLLGGSVLGLNLDGVVELNGKHATAPSPNDPDTYFNSLDLSVLDTLGLPLTPAGDFLSQILTIATPALVGTVNEYAYAESDGDSRGASGAVTDNGVVALNQGDDMPEFGTLDLRTIIANLAGAQAAALVAAVSNLQLQIGAIAGRAWVNPCTEPEVQRDYLLAHLRILITSPTVEALTTALTSAVQLVLATANIPLLVLNRRIQLDVSLLTGEIPAGANQPIKVNLGEGTVAVDVSTLLSNNVDPFGAAYSPFLNGLPANSVLFVDTPLPASTITNFNAALLVSLENVLLDALYVEQRDGVLDPSWEYAGSLRDLLSDPALGGVLTTAWNLVKAVLTGAVVGPALAAISTLLSNLFDVLQNVIRITVNAQNPVFENWNGILNASSTPTHTQYSVAALFVQAVDAANVLDLYLASGGVGPSTPI
ncbi:choice-of-anchor G family protein [Microbacterium sp. SD291]|uniref:choice-of-anchor G family protein n=1 Tax=Microbacterium sp. SD291 TaxID=2782007 RepID=UPI001A967423|nr:choice-of-anchor G family protein [Microbacterium sp. SD291]MBO0981020.1 choice-of-anchor G family protein [Microbacterium sp. SD291]